MASEWKLRETARVIRGGGVIGYPTEAVWGLGCDPWSEEAVLRILQLKSRPVEKGLILVADCIHQFDFLLNGLPRDWLDRLGSTWPGPNTWLVPHADLLPPWITGAHDTVALRVSEHPLVRDLCRLTGPLVSTSANPADRAPARSRLRLMQYFDGQLDAVLDGPLGGRRNPSLIRDLRTGEVVRQG